MKKFIVIFICALGITGYTVAQSFPTQAVTPTVNMQSVNNTSFMSSGSSYSSAVQEVGAYSPAGVRKAPPGHGGQSSDDFKTPDLHQPIGDALIPLMLCACAYLIVRATRRRTLNR